MKKVSDIQEGVLNHIFERLDTLKKIEEKIQPYLMPEIRPYCRVANFQHGILVFAVSSSAFGMPLKYSLPELLSTLRNQADLPQLASIKYYIEPDFKKLFMGSSAS